MSRGWATLRGANWTFRKLQLVSAAAYSLGHGANDAQKTMGIIAAVILIDQSSPIGDFEVSLPIVLAAHTAIALGTLSGGWRIVHTLGSKITKLHPIGGFSAESGAAITLFGRPPSVSPFRPLTPSRVQWWGSARRTAFQRCAGG